MFAVLSVQINFEDDEDLNERISELENLGYVVTVEYDGEDEDDGNESDIYSLGLSVRDS